MAGISGGYSPLPVREQLADEGLNSISRSMDSVSTATTKLIDAYNEMAKEKTLALSPGGGIGMLLGNILNLIPGEIGTSIFGGTPSAAFIANKKLRARIAESEMLSRAFYSMSPAANAELRDIMSNRTLDAKTKLGYAGMGSLYGLTGEDRTKVGEVIQTQWAIVKNLTQDFSDVFGTENLNNA